MPFSPQTTEIRLNNLEGQKAMTDTKHTPGPWQCHSYMAQGRTFSIESLNQHGKPAHGIAVIRPNETASSMLSVDEHEANARLIAAAPELLAALKRSAESLRIASETFGSEKLLSDCMYALAAIAKATGE